MEAKMNIFSTPQVHLATCGSWYLRQTAKAFEERGALESFWISDKNSTGVPAVKFRRCWPFHLAMKPFYRFAPQIWVEHAFYSFFPIWRRWYLIQPRPNANVVHAMIGFATEPFDVAERTGALKVLDCPNSHPLTYHGFWQRECDLWCPGEKVPIPQWMFARMNRELERADMILVASQFCKESMLWNGIPEEKVMVNPFGVDTSIFTKREVTPARPRYVSVGTICLRKGHQYLFRAFEIVKKQLPDAELICIGDYKTDFRREKPKWEGTFTHHPVLRHSELSEILRTSTAFVFPSQEEGFARAQMEALACGLPVVGTHEGGATTLIRDGVEGFIVPGRDPARIAEAMIKIAIDREMNARMGNAAYIKGAERNTWQDYGDRLLAEYARRKAAC